MTDPEQFEGFMSAYQDMVYSTALRLSGNESEAEDIAQEVFLKAYERYAELSASPTAGGWLRTVARNLTLNHLTRYRNRWKFFSELSGDEEEGQADFGARLAADMPETTELEATEMRALLDEAMQKLPDNQRIPLVLYHFEDQSYEAIAGQLGVSLGKVKTDIHRGREALKRRLQPRLADLQL